MGDYISDHVQKPTEELEDFVKNGYQSYFVSGGIVIISQTPEINRDLSTNSKWVRYLDNPKFSVFYSHDLHDHVTNQGMPDKIRATISFLKSCK